MNKEEESIDCLYELLIDKKIFFEKIQKTFGNEPVTNPQFFIESFSIILAFISIQNNLPAKDSILSISELFHVAYEGFVASEVTEKNGETVH